MRRIRAHLLGRGRDAGHGLAVLRDRREIADDENIRMVRQRKIRLHGHPARAIAMLAELPPERRRSDACGPQHGARRDAFDRRARRRRRRSRSPLRRDALRRRAVRADAARSPDSTSGIDGRTRGPASMRWMCASRGSMRRNSFASVCRAISASVPASSTPVGPPPITTRLSQAARAVGVGFALGDFECFEHLAAHDECVVERLEARRETGPVVVAEIGVRRAGRDDQEIVVERAAFERDASRARDRCRALRRAAPRRSSGRAGDAAAARRYQAPKDPLSRPDTAAAGRDDGSSGRRA